MKAVRRVLEAAVRDRVFPGAALGVWLRGEPRLRLAVGALSYDEGAAPVRLDTRYDLASLTKPLASAGLIARAVEAGRLRLEDRVRARLPDLPAAVPDVSLAGLLAHRSGAPACIALASAARLQSGGLCRGREERRALIFEGLGRLASSWGRPEAETRYSDVGFLILGLVIEEVFGCGLDRAFAAELTGPLGLAAPSFGPLEEAAPTERRPWQGDGEAGLRGSVHDENAAVLGGVAGHAGLFGDLDGVAALARPWIGEGLFSMTLRRRMTAPGPGGRALGWDTNHGPAGPVLGPRFSSAYFGHNGFTGGSLWLHAGGAVVALLSNRTWPRRPRDSSAIHALRRAVYEALAAEMPDLRSP